jgi:SH3-like domain-containing protein
MIFSACAFAEEKDFVYAKFPVLNLRVGPGKTYPINWVIKYKGEPLEVSHKIDNWLKCKDFEGSDGWVHVSNISKRDPHVIVNAPGKKYVVAYARANESARKLFRVESGRRSKLKKCDDKWCKISVNNQDAWILKSYLWGVS